MCRVLDRRLHAAAHVRLFDREHLRGDQLLTRLGEVAGRHALGGEHDHVVGLQVVDRLLVGRPCVAEHAGQLLGELRVELRLADELVLGRLDVGARWIGGRRGTRRAARIEHARLGLLGLDLAEPPDRPADRRRDQAEPEHGQARDRPTAEALLVGQGRHVAASIAGEAAGIEVEEVVRCCARRHAGHSHPTIGRPAPHVHERGEDRGLPSSV